MKEETVLILGAGGFVGRNVKERFLHFPETFSKNFICVNGKKDLDLCDEAETSDFAEDLNSASIGTIINCAGKTSGIKGNVEFPVEHCTENLKMQMNVYELARKLKAKLINLGAGCGYPEHLEILREENFFYGIPQMQSFPYSIAKKMLVPLSYAYHQQYGLKSINIIPGNIFGKFDNFDLQYSHVIPALVYKFYLAKKQNIDIEIWGDGSQVRDFVYADDLISFILFLYKEDLIDPKFCNQSYIINYSSGVPRSIVYIVHLLSEISGVDLSRVKFNKEKLAGQKRRLFDISVSKSLGFERDKSKETEEINFKNAILETYKWFEENYEKGLVRL